MRPRWRDAKLAATIVLVACSGDGTSEPSVPEATDVEVPARLWRISAR